MYGNSLFATGAGAVAATLPFTGLRDKDAGAPGRLRPSWLSTGLAVVTGPATPLRPHRVKFSADDRGTVGVREPGSDGKLRPTPVRRRP